MIEKSKAYYMFSFYRYIQSDFYKASIESDDIAPYLMFEGVMPEFNELQKIEALTRGIDNMNVNVYGIYNDATDAVEYIALNDFWKIYKFSPGNLTTISRFTAELPSKSHFSGVYKFLSFLSSAHPLPEYGTTNHFTFVSSVSVLPWKKSKISLVRMKSASDRELVAQWSVDRVPYMHSFSVTENYVIFFASPFYVNVEKMIESAEPFESLDWDLDESTTVYVVSIKTGDVTTLQAENMFSMHHVNAFEEDNKIVVDVSSYPSPDFVKNLELQILRDPVKRNSFDPHALLKRFVIDMKTDSVVCNAIEQSASVPFALNIDMPVINEKYRSKSYCYIYGIVLKKDNMQLGNIALVKKNVCGNSSEDKYWFIKGHYPVEPWYIPSPVSETEDDGILLVPVIDGYQGKSYLAVLDAKSMQLVNKAYLPTVVPYSLHGRFFEEVY